MLYIDRMRRILFAIEISIHSHPHLSHKINSPPPHIPFHPKQIPIPTPKTPSEKEKKTHTNPRLQRIPNNQRRAPGIPGAPKLRPRQLPALGQSPIQLRPRLCKFKRIRDCDFDGARRAAGDDAAQRRGSLFGGL